MNNLAKYIKMGIKHLASSANSNTIAVESVDGRLFINMRNKSGPSKLPCGTPEITGSVLDIDWPTKTH